MSTSYEVDLDFTPGVGAIVMAVRFTTRGREVTDYAVVLVARREGRKGTIRVYDCAHGHNEMHRYSSSGGKQSGIGFHSGTLGEGLRAAIDEVECRYHQMVEGWERQ